MEKDKSSARAVTKELGIEMRTNAPARPATNNRTTSNEEGLLSIAKVELDEAARIQPCPGCKHDIEQLSNLLGRRLASLRGGRAMDGDPLKTLRELDYLNELTDIGIFMAGILDPIARRSPIKVPEIYAKVLKDDMPANSKVRKHLKRAAETISRIENRGTSYAAVSEIVESFIRATDFKLSIDPLTFYLFDKTIRIGHSTHLLGATSRAIVLIKGIGRRRRPRRTRSRKATGRRSMPGCTYA